MCYVCAINLTTCMTVISFPNKKVPKLCLWTRRSTHVTPRTALYLATSRRPLISFNSLISVYVHWLPAVTSNVPNKRNTDTVEASTVKCLCPCFCTRDMSRLSPLLIMDVYREYKSQVLSIRVLYCVQDNKLLV